MIHLGMVFNVFKNTATLHGQIACALLDTTIVTGSLGKFNEFSIL